MAATKADGEARHRPLSIAPQMGFGAAGLGQNFRRISDEDAQATVEAAWAEGIRLYDTAPGYGLGLSEHRLGQALYRKPRADFQLSSKVGRCLIPGGHGRPDDSAGWLDPLPNAVKWDFTYDGIMRAFEDSLQRLRLDRIDFLFIHDLDAAHHKPDALTEHFHNLESGGIRALEKLRQEGTITGFGSGINFQPDISKMVDRFDLDVMMIAAPYTLLHQDALPDLNRSYAQGIQVLIGAVFQSGLLATGLRQDAKYNYGETVPEPIISRVRALTAVCDLHGVSLAAAALQFPLAHPAVAAVVPGAIFADEVHQNALHLKEVIPSDFWLDLVRQNLVSSDAPLPAGCLTDRSISSTC